MYRLRITGDIGFEFWKDIPEYEGLYQASTYGRVRSLERVVVQSDGRIRVFPSTILKPSSKNNGYLIVGLVKRPVLKTKNLHKLIAQTFIPNPNNLPQVNHKDENRFNNRVENLEWCTAKYNCNYGNRNQKIWETRRQNSL